MSFDGAIVAMGSDELLRVYETVPQWIAEALGPPLSFLGGQRVHVEIQAIFRETREEALGVLTLWIRETCAKNKMEYDEDDWTVLRLDFVNGS